MILSHVWKRLAEIAAAAGGDKGGPDKIELLTELGQALKWGRLTIEAHLVNILDWSAVAKGLHVTRERLGQLTVGELEALISLFDANCREPKARDQRLRK